MKKYLPSTPHELTPEKDGCIRTFDDQGNVLDAQVVNIGHAVFQVAKIDLFGPGRFSLDNPKPELTITPKDNEYFYMLDTTGIKAGVYDGVTIVV